MSRSFSAFHQNVGVETSWSVRGMPCLLFLCAGTKYQYISSASPLKRSKLIYIPVFKVAKITADVMKSRSNKVSFICAALCEIHSKEFVVDTMLSIIWLLLTVLMHPSDI